MIDAGLWGMAALAAAIFGLRHAGDETGGGAVAASAWKTLSTAALAALALYAGASGWIVAGLALGSVGDFALSRPGTGAFLAGMAAFALGHLAYVVEFVPFWLSAGAAIEPALIGAALLMGALVGWTLLWLAPRAGALAWPVRGYALVIGAMVLAASALPDIPGRTATLAGVVLFAASDLILALRMFVLQDRARRLLAARVLWPLYWVGQALILAGALS